MRKITQEHREATTELQQYIILVIVRPAVRLKYWQVAGAMKFLAPSSNPSQSSVSKEIGETIKFDVLCLTHSDKRSYATRGFVRASCNFDFFYQVSALVCFRIPRKVTAAAQLCVCRE